MDNVLEKINRAGVKLLKPLTPEETYQTIITEAIKLIGADFGSIFLQQERILERVHTSHPKLFNIKIRPGGFTNTALKEHKSFIVEEKYISKFHSQLKQMGVKSDLITPLFYKNKPIGVLSLLSKRSLYFTHKHLDIMILFSSVASLAIRKAQSYNETQKALETRNLFISMAAHELRTPLTTINGYVQLLQAKKGSQPDLQYGQWIDELSWETFRLTQLVNELLEVNRIKTGKLQYSFKECSLKKVVARAITDFKFNHPNRTVYLEDNIGKNKDTMVGDFDKLLQVVINLLDNAAKFSAEKSDIWLKLEVQDSILLLEVKDQGIGIDKKDLPNLFKEFFKGGNKQRSGMGLGLFLCKSIIQQHRGSIMINSKPKEGTLVRIKLPRVKSYKE